MADIILQPQNIPVEEKKQTQKPLNQGINKTLIYIIAGVIIFLIILGFALKIISKNSRNKTQAIKSENINYVVPRFDELQEVFVESKQPAVNYPGGKQPNLIPQKSILKNLKPTRTIKSKPKPTSTVKPENNSSNNYQSLNSSNDVKQNNSSYQRKSLEDDAARRSDMAGNTNFSTQIQSAPPVDSVDDPAKNRNKLDFYSQGKPAGAFISATIDDGNKEYTINEGTIINATLITAINSDLPGNILAVTNANIYDSYSGKNILLPQGSKILAQYNSDVSFGQSRVQISWSKIIRPDNVKIDLGNMPGVDSYGASGLKGSVDTHPLEVLKGLGAIILFSVLNSEIAYQAASLASPGMVDLTAKVQDAANNVGQSYTDKALNIQPTIRVSSGKQISIFVTTEMVLPVYNF